MGTEAESRGAAMDTDADRPMTVEDLVAALAGFFGGRAAKVKEKGDRLLTIRDLMARWQVGQDVILAHIRDDGLRFVPIGRSQGHRPQYRFRVSAVEKWEAERERVRMPEETPAPKPTPLPGAMPAGWDGIDRLRIGGKKAAKKSRTK